MRKTLCAFVCAFMTLVAWMNPAKAQIPLQMQRVAVPAGTTTYGYMQYLPGGFTSRNDWPLIVYLHGSGECGNGSSESILKKVEDQGVAFEIANHGRKLPAVVLAPQSPVTTWNAASIDQIVNYAIANYRVDSNRVYITGYDAGGTGAIAYLNAYPNKVAAVAPVCGNAAVSDGVADTVVGNNTPIWAFHSIDDDVYPATPDNPNGPWTTFTRLAAARGATSYGALDGYVDSGTVKTGYIGSDGKRYAWDFNAMDYLKNGNPFSAQQIWTVFPGGSGHYMWGQIFESNKLYDWMLGKSKATSKPGQRILVPPSVSGLASGFIAYLPEDYPSRANWPLIVFLHGTDGRGDGSTNNLTGLPLLEGRGIANEIAFRGRKVAAVVIAPQAATSATNWDVAKIDEVLTYALSHYGVDSKRVTVTGLEMGGGGTWDYANAHLDRIAAAMPIASTSGDGTGHGELDFTVAATVVSRNFPLWAASIRNDPQETYVWNSFNRLLVKRTGNNGPTGLASFERYPSNPTSTLTGYFCDNLQNYAWNLPGQDYKRNGAVISPSQIWTVYLSNAPYIWEQMYRDDKAYDWMLAQSR